MSEKVSKELRQALDNPATRHRIVDAWLVTKKQEEIKSKAPVTTLPSTKGAKATKA